MRIKILTSLLFIIPAVIAAWAGMYLIAGIIVTVTIASVIFHLKKERAAYWFDKIAAYVLVIFNFILLYLSDFRTWYTVFVAVGVIISFWFYFRARRKNYAINHSLWHVSSVIITILCLLAYIQGL